MPGLLFIITLTVLLSGCDAFRLGSSRRVAPLSPPVGHVLQDEGPIQPHVIQEIVRTKRHSVQELVRAQPHLVHDMGRPEVHKTSRSQAKMDSGNSSNGQEVARTRPADQEVARTRHTDQEVARTRHIDQEVARTRHTDQEVARTRSTDQEVARTRPAVEENLGVEDEMERMVHLVVPQDGGSYRGPPDSTGPERELLAGPGDVSMEASGFYGTDMEDRDRGEEGGEERDRRGGEDEWERDMEEDKERRGGEDKERRGGEDKERRGGEDKERRGGEDKERRGGEDKERRGGEDKERRGGEDKERRGGEDKERRGGEARGEEEGTEDDTHTSPDLDALIGYSPSGPSNSNQTSLSPAEGQDSGLQEHRASQILEARPVAGGLWGEEGHSSGFGGPHSSVTTPPAGGTSPPETDTGTDFGLLGGFTRGAAEEEETERDKEVEEEEGLTHRGLFTQNPTVAEGGVAPSREPLQPSVEEEEELQEEEHRFIGHNSEEVEGEGTRMSHMVPRTTNPPPTVGFTNPSWDWLEKTTPLQTPRSEVRGGGVTEDARQVMCVDWSQLSERGYVLLNTTENLNCEEFRVDQGVRLLKVIERVFARRMNSPEGSWEVYLSKPTHQQHQLLMNVVSEHGVIATTEVLSMLGEIRRMLSQVGIQNYSPPSSCTSRPSPTRSDYGKLFVVLVIIGSVCMIIITSGFVYICWQRRPPGAKTTFRGEELHFVENSCHDNPTLDVTNDNQPEMREKKPSTNGLAAGGGVGEEGSRWKVFINQAATEEEEEEEQDTHL